MAPKLIFKWYRKKLSFYYFNFRHFLENTSPHLAENWYGSCYSAIPVPVPIWETVVKGIWLFGIRRSRKL